MVQHPVFRSFSVVYLFSLKRRQLVTQQFKFNKLQSHQSHQICSNPLGKIDRLGLTEKVYSL
jgi:hypothetical protein